VNNNPSVRATDRSTNAASFSGDNADGTGREAHAAGAAEVDGAVDMTGTLPPTYDKTTQESVAVEELSSCGRPPGETARASF
jgi:hypothetical protein